MDASSSRVRSALVVAMLMALALLVIPASPASAQPTTPDWTPTVSPQSPRSAGADAVVAAASRW
ncbi:MAG: hypothetical protein ACJ72W_03205 [Actinoallomurus sp.]